MLLPVVRQSVYPFRITQGVTQMRSTSANNLLISYCWETPKAFSSKTGSYNETHVLEFDMLG